jgi:hypothetical protein
LLIKDETYQKIFIEFAIINHMDKKLLRNRPKEELVDSIYEHYGVTQEQFRYTHDYFESDIPEQLLRMEKILIRLRTESNKVDSIAKQHQQELKVSADSLHQRIRNR